MTKTTLIKSSSVALGLISLALFSGVAYAEETNTANIGQPPPAIQTTRPPENSTAFINTIHPIPALPPQKNGSDSAKPHFANLKEEANSLIDNRLAELQNITARIQATTRLQDNEKQSLLTDIQAATTQLTQLKATLTTSASDSATRQTIKAQYSSLRLQPNLSQKLNLIIITDDLMTVISKVQTYLQSHILEATGSTSLSNLSAKLTTDTNTIQIDQALLLNTAISSSSAQTTFQKVRSDLTGIKNDLSGLRSNLKVSTKLATPSGQTKPPLVEPNHPVATHSSTEVQ